VVYLVSVTRFGDSFVSPVIFGQVGKPIIQWVLVGLIICLKRHRHHAKTACYKRAATDESLIVDLADGRTISIALVRYSRLMLGSAAERNNWRLIGGGEGIHWPDLDEDISVENIIMGKVSGESQPSFKQWLEKRQGRETESPA
jgi:hypothetical protein